MSVNIVVPELSESVVEATVAEWLKQPGDAIEAGEVLVILETDKVALEVTAETNGTMGEIIHDEGADVGAGEVLGNMEAGEGGAAPAPAKSEPTPEPAAQPAAQSAAPASGQKATPVAQRAAAQHGVDLASVAPSNGDRVRKNDVLSAATQPPTPARSAAPAKPAPKPAASLNGASGRDEERVRMSRRRQTIAKRLVEAQQTAAMLTTFNEVDMSAVMDMRKRRKEAFKEKHGVGLGFSSFFVKAVVGALKAFPMLNAEIDDERKEFVVKKYYDIGMAIGAEEGLVVPVLRNADRMSFAGIEQQIKDYAKQAQDGTLSIESLMGGTFTITNGGVFGSLLSTPILNPPQVGILGLHGIKERPVVVDGEIAIRPMMYTALSYDHRIVDGREAVQFLVRIKDLIEDPETLLIEG